MTFILIILAGFCRTVSTQSSTVPFYDGKVIAAKAGEGEWQWHPMAVGGGGYNLELIFDPENPKRIYLRTDVAGVIKTEDGGGHWRNSNDGLQGLGGGNYGIGAIGIDSRQPNIVYASIGRAWQASCGIVKSIDYGESWRWLSGEVCVYGEGLARKGGGPGLLVDPREGSRLYVIDYSHNNGAGGIWISTDGGVHWKPSGLNDKMVFTLRFHPTNPDRVYAATTGDGLYRSADRGTTWQQIGLQKKAVFNFQFETGNPETIYAVCGPEGIFKTADGGRTWKHSSKGLPLASEGAKGNDFGFDSFPYEYTGLDVDARRPGHLVTAARVIRAFYESTDGAATWHPITVKKIVTPKGWMLSPNHFGWSSSQIYFGPETSGTLYVCDFWGTWKSMDYGETWSIHPYGLENSCMVTVLPDCGMDRRLYLGIWDHDMLVYTDEDRVPFTQRPAGLLHEGGAHVSGIAQDARNPQILLCVTRSSHLQRSTDRGMTWSKVKKGFPEKTPFRIGAPVMASKAGIYFVPVNDDGIYASKDRGETWIRPAGKGLGKISVTGQWSPEQNVFAVLDDGSLLAIATGGKLYLSTDEGKSWESPAVPSPARKVALADKIYLGCADGLYASGDRGKTWDLICPKRTGVNLLTVDSKDSRRILCHMSGEIKGTPDRIDYSLMYTEDSGRRWTNLFNRTLAVRRLQGIAFDPFDKSRIYANTFWAGAWVAKRPSSPATTPITITGPWTLQVGPEEYHVKKAVQLTVSPPAVCRVRDEEYSSLPVYDEKAPVWMKGDRLKGLITDECTAAGLLLPGSVRVKPAAGAAGFFVLNRDFCLDGDWARIGRTVNSAIKADQKVYIDYDYVPCRLDSIVVDQRGAVRLVTGMPGVGVVLPPVLKAGETAVANVWFQGPTAKLTEENLFPIQFNLRDENKKPVAEKLLPRTLAKLREGRPLTILAWGDSVTNFNWYQTMFVDRLKQRFPKAKINLVTVAWGGQSSGSFLGVPKGHPFNFEEKCLGARPDTVIIEFVNDAPLNEAEVLKQYGSIIQRFRQIGTEVILMTPHFIRPDWMGKNTMKFDEDPRPYVRGLKMAAEKYQVALADASRLWGRLWRQGIPYITLELNSINHPDKRGHQLFARALMELFPEK